MAVYHDPRAVRRIAEQTFEAFGAAEEQVADLDEHLLVQNGRYYARTYRTDDLMAMWFIDIQLLQVYGASGEMLATINLGQDTPAVRLAA